MNRNDAIALGLSALVVGAVASTAQYAAPGASGSTGPRTLPPSLARRAFAARDGVELRSAPSPNAAVEGTFGLGSGFLVGPEAVPGWFPIVREWVEDNQRYTRDLAFVSAADITFSDPRKPVALSRTGATPTLGRTDGGECDAFIKITWPHGVDDFKGRLDTLFSATDRSMRDCAALSRSQKDEWAVFYAKWKKFVSEPTSTFGSGTDWDTACSYSRTLDGWRDVLANTKCEVVGPTSIHGYDVPTSTQGSLENLATIVKWGSIAVGSAVLIGTFYPEIREGLGALRARRAARRLKG